MLEKHKGNFPRVIDLYTSHTIPGFVCLGNSFLTNTVLHRKMIKPMAILLVSYAALNVIQFQFTGRAAYWFFDWRTLDSFIVCVGMLIVISFFYIVMCKIDESVKYDSLIKKNVGKLKSMTFKKKYV